MKNIFVLVGIFALSLEMIPHENYNLMSKSDIELDVSQLPQFDISSPSATIVNCRFGNADFNALRSESG